MANPLVWLALSLLLLALSLAAVLLAAIPTLRELSRAARSAEKLFDTLDRELPPTLEALRRTGQEITGLTDDISPGVQAAGRVVQQVDQSLVTARQQAQLFNTGSRSLLAGVQAAWQTWHRTGQRPPRRKKRLGHQRSTLPEPRQIVASPALTVEQPPLPADLEPADLEQSHPVPGIPDPWV